MALGAVPDSASASQNLGQLQQRMRSCEAWDESFDYQYVDVAALPVQRAAEALASHYEQSGAAVRARRQGREVEFPERPEIGVQAYIQLARQTREGFRLNYRHGTEIRRIFERYVPESVSSKLVVTPWAGDRDDPEYQFRAAEEFKSSAWAWSQVFHGEPLARYAVAEMCKGLRREILQAEAEVEAARQREEAAAARSRTSRTGGSAGTSGGTGSGGTGSGGTGSGGTGSGGTGSGGTGSGGTGSGAASSPDGAADSTGGSARSGRQASDGASSEKAENVPTISSEEFQLQQMLATLDSGIDHEAISEALLEASWAERIVYFGTILAIPLFLNRSEGERDAGSPTMSMEGWSAFIFAGVGSAVAGGSLIFIDWHSKQRLEVLDRESRRWHGQLTAACRRGSAEHCRRGVALQRDLNDLGRPARDREQSSALLGFGSAWGPPFEWRFSMGYATDARASIGGAGPALQGPLHGGTLEYVLRARMFRLSASYTQLYAPLDGLGAGEPGTGSLGIFGTGFGVQGAQGLLSPYLELRARNAWNSSEHEVMDGLVGLDSALVIGNTFNFTGLFSSRGPYVRSLVLDASYVVPLGESTLHRGLTLSFGFTTQWSVAMSRYRPRKSPLDDPDLRHTWMMGYVFPVGVGLEFGRLGGPDLSDYPNFTVSLMEGWMGFADGRVHLAGVSGFGMGYRWFLGESGVHELGVGFPAIGAQFSTHLVEPAPGQILEPEERASDGRQRVPMVGFLPARLYYRNYTTGMPVEAGVKMPVFWMPMSLMNSGSDDSVGLYGGPPPAIVYLGAGF